MVIMKPSTYIAGNGKYVLYVLNVIGTVDKPAFVRRLTLVKDIK